MHRSPNNAQNTQHKLGVAFLIPRTQQTCTWLHVVSLMLVLVHRLLSWSIHYNMHTFPDSNFIKRTFLNKFPPTWNHACYCWQNKTILSQNLWWPSGGKCFCSFYRHNCHDESCKPVILIPYISLYYVPVNSNCTSPIIHRACLSTLCITVNFNFSWVLQCMVLREIKRRCFFKILGDKQRKLMWETAVSPFCANRQAYSRTRKKEKACLHLLT